MDDDFLARFRERSAYEAGREGPPDGFPKLPDLPLGATPTRVPGARARAPVQAGLALRRPRLRAPDARQLQALRHRRRTHPPRPGRRRSRSVPSSTPAGCALRGRGECGQARVLVCQFHSWSYDLRGNLVRVPDERDFVGLQKEAGPAVRALRAMGRLVVREPRPRCHAPARVAGSCRPAARGGSRSLARHRHQAGRAWLQLEDPAEAFLEVYHARTIHPKTVGPSLDTRGTVITLYDHGHQSMLSPVNRGTQERQP